VEIASLAAENFLVESPGPEYIPGEGNKSTYSKGERIMPQTKSALLVAAGIASLASTSFAVTEINLGTPRVVASAPLDKPELYQPSRELEVDAVYSNVDNGLLATYSPAGATLQGTNTITRLVADDLTTSVDPGAGREIYAFEFTVVNTSTTAPVTYRPRLRFWFPNSSTGAPGAYFNQGLDLVSGLENLAVGYTFNPLTLAPNTFTTYYADFTPDYAFGLDQGETLWMGMSFDNNNGGTGATAAQLNALALGVFDPPDVGSSDDTIAFQTTNAGSFFNTANPAGGLFGFSNGPTNFGFSLIAYPVPEPTTLAALGVAGLAALRRRRA
jgi:hypothetical protein